MSWRPEGWEKIKEGISYDLGYRHTAHSQWIDAGADAILTALIKSGKHFIYPYHNSELVMQYLVGRMNGTLVFIPDKEE
jgi:hypothetical protein